MLPTWDDARDADLTDLVFDTNLSPKDMADQLGTSELFIKTRIKDLGLGWVRRNQGARSRGQAALTTMMRKLLPGEKITTEEAIGERLFLDIYCDKYKLAIEYHGRQHFQYVEHFHKDKEGFLDSQRRDERKEDLCKDLGIALVAFRYCDDLSEDVVFERLLDAIRTAPTAIEPKEKKTLKGEPSYESWKKRQSEYRRASYKRMRAGK